MKRANYKFKLVKIILILVIMFLFSCKGFFPVKEHVSTIIDNESIEYKSIANTDFFTVDSLASVYVRRLYLNEDKDKTFELISNHKDVKSNTLIEVQYFIFNKDKVLYISTIPAKRIYDKTDTYLLNNNGKIKYPNTFFINSFYFGKFKNNNEFSMTNDTIEFKNKSNLFRWNVSFAKDSQNRSTFKVNSIDTYKLKKIRNGNPLQIYSNTIVTEYAQKNSLIFTDIYKYNNKNYFHYLSYKKPNNINNKSNDSINYPKCKRIYIVYTDSKKEKVKDVILPFNVNIIDDYNEIRFKGNRVKFLPKP